jgi:large subunit ribosomal protein L4
MSSVQLKDLKGKSVGEVKFDGELFDIEPNLPVLHSALHRQLTNARAGTASTLTRSEVRGGGRKPWRQKGTGRARAGSTRSPLWAGGGVIFGPKPRDYSISMTKKSRQLALRSAIAARKADFVVVQNFDGLFSKAPREGQETEQPKTKAFVAVLNDLGIAGKKVLVLLDSGVPGAAQIEKAARNIAGLLVCNITNLNVKALLQSDAVLTSERTVEALNNRFRAHASKQKLGALAKHGTAKERKAAKAAATKGEGKTKAKTRAAAPKADAEEKSAKEPKTEKSKE